MKVLLCSLFLILMVSFEVHSQGGGLTPPPNPDPVPITGLEYLLIGGGVYGVSKFLKKRKNKQDPS